MARATRLAPSYRAICPSREPGIDRVKRSLRKLSLALLVALAAVLIEDGVSPDDVADLEVQHFGAAPAGQSQRDDDRSGSQPAGRFRDRCEQAAYVVCGESARR